MYPVGGHAVGGDDGAQCAAALVGALVAHDAYALDGKQDDSRLPYLIIQSVATQGVDEDLVGVLKDAHFLGCDLAEDADAESGAREGMAPEEVGADAEGTAYAAHLILEEETQGLDDAEVHLLGESADVVMRLDGGGRSVDRYALDDVGIDCALGEPARSLYLLCLLVEDLYEVAAYDLALALGVGDAGKVGVEALAGVDATNVETHVLIGGEHVGELVLAEQAVVDEDAGEVGADGAVEQDGGHGGVDATGKAEDHAVVADLRAKLGHRGIDERVGTPGAGASADAEHEVGEETRPVGGMIHLGVELYAPGLLAHDMVGGDADIVGGADDVVRLRDGDDGVAVAHPHLCGRGHVGHEGVEGVDHGEHGAAILAAGGALHLAAVFSCEELGSVAYAEQGKAAFHDGKVGLGCLRVAHRVGAAGEDHALHVGVELRPSVEGVDLAIDVEFADSSGDELRVLGAEIYDDYFFHCLIISGFIGINHDLSRLIMIYRD